MTANNLYVMVKASLAENEIVQKLKASSTDIDGEIFIIDRPLAEKRYDYKSNVLILLLPGHKILLINCGESEERFNEFKDDFTEDLGYLSDKFGYKDHIGRPREWRKTLFSDIEASAFDGVNTISTLKIESNENKRKVDLLIGLLTGSINDINKIGVDVPKTLIEMVKKKIVLFDGNQTDFIYQPLDKRKIRIQGLSGTGKTELLLHRLKELYTSDENSKILFTCHNKILAHSLRQRIPSFFNFLRVEQQIKWNERFWCIGAWGGSSDKNSGTYRLITDFFGVPYSSFTPGVTFGDVCKNAISLIRESAKYKSGLRPFDYVLIDESQDFPETFFELCELSCGKQTIIAGDIFQSIFSEERIKEISPDFLLSKCYRTDPRTLMFAHGLGMGLFEKEKLQWLIDDQWKACGYNVKREPGKIIKLGRDLIRRFEEQRELSYPSVLIKSYENGKMESLAASITKEIEGLKLLHPDLTPDDLGIIFVDSSKGFYSLAGLIAVKVQEKLNWTTNIGYESKESIPGTLLITNKNNVKGLEFPFVICVTNVLHTGYGFRNSIYMMLTRSFITSYLFISDGVDSDQVADITNGLRIVDVNGCIEAVEPSEEEIDKIRMNIKMANIKKTYDQIMSSIFEELDVMPKARPILLNKVRRSIDETVDLEDYDRLLGYTEFFYKMMRSDNA